MVDAPPRRLFEGWGPLASLPHDLQEQLHPQLRSISLQPGEMLYDFEHLPPGVLYLQQGQLRLLGLDQRKEPFTLERYNSGQLAGAELLLRGIPGQAMAASTVERCPAEALPEVRAAIAAFTASARSKIEAAGGSCELLD